ncbi:MAG: thiamine pyrophosphate-dependent enzyme [Candidatus Hodarchaeota archaeon]
MSNMIDLIADEPGKRTLMIGNHALARGAIEAGVGFASTYPGTPASEVGDILSHLTHEIPMYFEYSINEAAAIEAAAGASWCNVRSLCTMKHVGLNVASDAMHGIAQSGVEKEGGLVVILAADPGSLSSSNEQDDRWFAYHLNIPLIEPSSVQEAKDWLVKSYDISEKFDVPVLLYPTSRICHNTSDVTLGSLQEMKVVGEYKDKSSRVNAGPLGVENKKRLQRNINKLVKKIPKLGFNRVLEGDSKIGIITASTAFGYTLEALDLMGIYDIPILKMGLTYPLNDAEIIQFVESHGLEKIIIVEELLGFLEFAIKNVLYTAGINIPIYGKDKFNYYGELDIDLVRRGISKVLDIELPGSIKEIASFAARGKGMVPPRMPSLCAGCPHMSIFYALKKVKEKYNVAITGGDIGCYTIGSAPPYNALDWVVCMGAGIGIAEGASHCLDKDAKVTAIIGDGTFFHTGMPNLLNAVYNKAEMTIIVAENHWVGMTGHQPTPSTGLDSQRNKTTPINIKDIAKAMQVPWIRTVDPYNVKKMIATIKEAFETDGLKMIIADQECALQQDRRWRRKFAERDGKLPIIQYQIEPERCQKCDECLKVLSCVAISTKKIGDAEAYYIEPARCSRCGACLDICPNSAIYRTDMNIHLED